MAIMPIKICTFNYFLVFLLIPVNACPDECFCAKTSVSCTNGLSESWTDLLLSIWKSQIHKLDIHGANFHSINKLWMLPNIRHIHLLNNHISQIDEFTFIGLVHLKSLQLSQNTIDNLRSDVFQDLDNLASLNLSHNSLTKIPNGIFLRKSHLTHIDLSHNMIIQIGADLFNGLTSLTHLDISYNKINVISPTAFNTLINMKVLHMCDNQLVHLHEQAMINLNNLTHLHLENNPWNCQCGLNWIIRDLHNHAYYKNRQRMICNQPLVLQGTPIEQLEFDELTCQPPIILNITQNITVSHLQDVTLWCNASGEPTPGVYWTTPMGQILVHPSHAMWLPPELYIHKGQHAFAGARSYFKSEATVQKDGSLVISQIRNYFAGQFTCTAINPSGYVNETIFVTQKSTISEIFMINMILAAGSAGICIVLTLIYGGICLCLEACLKKNKKMFDLPDIIIDDSECGEHTPLHSPAPCQHSPFWIQSLRASPQKYGGNTPLATSDSEEEIDGAVKLKLRQSLEEARRQLRIEVDRRMTMARSQMKEVKIQMKDLKQSGSQYIHKLGENSRYKLQTIRASSRQYGQRMREGVVLGVEQVKHHIHSMKELCGTGDISHTISIASMTNVDTEVQSHVVVTKTETVV
ncbi:unnamed protein product [Owenia fusiformis]|uniref:Ig-like domain-containing protein n=1 Tax=Owenia fusiformis TaxID=6347 RepID=A0A8S4N3X6_OWEFU|nr:unnamed protein product [Owenia fusiformis]